MTKKILKFVIAGPSPSGMESEIRDCFTNRNLKKGFKLLRKYLNDSPQIHCYTIYSIIISFVGGERINQLNRLRNTLLNYHLPMVFRMYLDFTIFSFIRDLPNVELAFRRLRKHKFPLDILVKNLYADLYFKWVIEISLWKKCPKGVDILELRMGSYMGLHNWELAKETANDILHIDVYNKSGLCTLARLSIISGDYNGALNSLNEAESNNTFDAEVQYLKGIAAYYLGHDKESTKPNKRLEKILIDQSAYEGEFDFTFEKLRLGEKVELYPQRTNQKTNIKREKRNSWDTIKKIELVIDDGAVENVPPYYLIIQFSDGHTSAPVKLTPMHFSFFWFLIGQHLSGENWIARINEQEICKKIESIWKTVYHETFSESVYEYLDYDSHIVDMRKEDKLFEILRSFDSINAIISRNKGAWVIDPRNGRRRTYISSIRSALNSAVQDMNFPTDIFKSTRKKEIHGIEWQGLYKLNPSLVSQIKFVTLEI